MINKKNPVLFKWTRIVLSQYTISYLFIFYIIVLWYLIRVNIPIIPDLWDWEAELIILSVVISSLILKVVFKLNLNLMINNPIFFVNQNVICVTLYFSFIECTKVFFNGTHFFTFIWIDIYLWVQKVSSFHHYSE